MIKFQGLFVLRRKHIWPVIKILVQLVLRGRAPVCVEAIDIAINSNIGLLYEPTLSDGRNVK
jgi:hypothetical protein